MLLGLGLSEAMPHPFLTDGRPRAGRPARPRRCVSSTRSAVGDDVLRTSLRPGLLKAIAFNESHRRTGAALFEIGHVYPPSDEVLPAEYEALGVVLAGADATEAMAVWRELAAAMGWGARLDQGTVPAGLHPTRSATLSLGKDVVGAVGEIHPDVLDAYGITERVAVLELDLGTLLAPNRRSPSGSPPAVSRRATSTLRSPYPTRWPPRRSTRRSARAPAQPSSTSPCSTSTAARVSTDGSRSLAYRLRLQAGDRTLTDADVAQVRDKVVAAAAKLGAQLRA